ncbi:transposase [Streptococcus pseudoporcinus]|uniref:transposase n=1 Tax=Streptococcus pseudoporcinus TaxID=361101 RepID=UPI001CC2692F|nr:transposase [Streptococcus pseudoporcinus]
MHSPSTSAFSRFKQQLAQEVGAIETWAQEAIEELYQFLPDFGKQLVLDGKIIETYASPHGQKKRKDKRADVEADFTIKAKYHKNGRVMTEIFDGYHCHLLVDATYELLIAWQMTPASMGEATVAQVMIKPLSTSVLDQSQELLYKGYDKFCDSLCYGFHSKNQDDRIFRLKRSVETIIFNQVARSSHKFKQLYKKRSSVERVNGRLERDFRFEDHTIRGLGKMTSAVGMSFLIRLGFALFKLKNRQISHLASWVV